MLQESNLRVIEERMAPGASEVAVSGKSFGFPPESAFTFT
jgi:hypothetical protein